MLLLTGLAYLLRWHIYWKPRKMSDIAWKPRITTDEKGFDRSIDTTKWHQKENGITILIPVHNEAQNLQQNLPFLLEQDFDNYEVVVVDDASDDDTSFVLTQMKHRYPHLQHLILPKGLQHARRLRLAISIGVKAATKEWVLLTQADCKPNSNRWLEGISAFFDNERQLIQGYVNYQDDESRETRHYQRKRMLHFFNMACSSRRGMPSEADICNLCIRRDVFLERGIFSLHLAKDADEGTIMVDALKNAEPSQYALCFAPETTLRQTYLNKEFAKYEMRRKSRIINRSGRWMRLRKWCYQATKALFWLTSLLYIALAALNMPHLLSQNEALPIVWAAAPILTVLLFVLLPALCYRYGTKPYL